MFGNVYRLKAIYLLSIDSPLRNKRFSIELKSVLPICLANSYKARRPSFHVLPLSENQILARHGSKLPTQETFFTRNVSQIKNVPTFAQ